MKDILGNDIYPNQSAVIIRNGVMEKDVKVVNIAEYKVLVKNKKDTEYFVDPDKIVVNSDDVFVGMMLVSAGVFWAVGLISYGLTTNLILSFGIALLSLILTILFLSYHASK